MAHTALATTNCAAIMLSKLAMLACVAGASAALELTPENYDKEVTASGKAAFIKFLAPW